MTDLSDEIASAAVPCVLTRHYLKRLVSMPIVHAKNPKHLDGCVPPG